MRLACVHCFTIEADDASQGAKILRDLQGKINAASERLDIGYMPGFISGQAQPIVPEPVHIDPGRLFDD